MGRSSLAASAMQRFLEKMDKDRPSAFTASVFVEPLLTRARILSYSATAPGIEKVIGLITSEAIAWLRV